MPTPNQLLAAARALDWGELESLLLNLPVEDRPDRVQWLVGEIRQQGYTICRRPVKAEIARRDAFLQSFRSFLDNSNLKAIADEWRAYDAANGAIEWGYHQIIASVRAEVHGQLSPDCHIWASLRHLEDEFAVVRQACTDWKLEDGKLLDPAAIRVKLPNGSEVQPDGYLTTLTDAATATLKMLGIASHWFRAADGRLILPIQPPSGPSDTSRASNVHGLGVIWQLLERSDQHMRFFGGNACVRQVNLRDTDGRAAQANALVCELDGGLIIYDQVAHERLSRMLMQFWHQLNWETAADRKVVNTTPVALPPAAFVSLEEAIADISISQFLCKAVVEHQDEPGGLRIIEWIRGYSCLKLYAQQTLKQAKAGGTILLDREELRQFLSARGLSPEKSHSFIESIIFSRDEPDLFDAPLLEVADGRYLFCAAVAGEINPVEVVLSKLATVSADLAWRGPAFEETVRELFQKKGIAVRHINRQINGGPLEVDCVVYWEGILFVFECKNVSLSGKSNESTYRFYQQQEHAITQVIKKRDVLLANPAILEEAFGEPLHIDRTVAIVLNAMPFSMGELSDGLYIYDYSALNRFFESRHLKAIIPAKVGDTLHILRRHGFKSLWSGDQPAAEDLIRQMKDPVQLKACLDQYEWIQVVLPLGENTVLATSRARRNVGGLEAELTAMGVNGERIASEICDVQDEFSKQVQQLNHAFEQPMLEVGRPTEA